MPIFYDTHAHLDYPEFAQELPEVIARAQSAGIAKIISIGTDLDSSKRAIKLAEQFPNVFAVVGWHPSHADQAPTDLRPALRELARHPKVVALGETGLGLSSFTEPEAGVHRERTTSVTKRNKPICFASIWKWPRKSDLNCVIHQRDSLEDTLAQLQPLRRSRAGRIPLFRERRCQRCGAFWRWGRS